VPANHNGITPSISATSTLKHSIALDPLSYPESKSRRPNGDVSPGASCKGRTGTGQNRDRLNFERFEGVLAAESSRTYTQMPRTYLDSRCLAREDRAATDSGAN